MVVLAAALLAAAGQSITSSYTPFALDRCRAIATSEDGSGRFRCAGPAGTALFVQAGDDRFDLDAGVEEDRDQFWSEAYNRVGARIEWRLRGGRPFAIIYRLHDERDGRALGSRLIVESIGRSGAPGCRIADIPGRLPDANRRARTAADAIARGPARCLRDRG